MRVSIRFWTYLFVLTLAASLSYSPQTPEKSTSKRSSPNPTARYRGAD